MLQGELTMPSKKDYDAMNRQGRLDRIESVWKRICDHLKNENIGSMKRLRITRRPFLPATRRIIPKHFEDNHAKNLLSTHSLFHPNRLYLFIISIAFVLAPFLTISCQSPPDPQPIRECF